MNWQGVPDPIVIALDIAEPGLADRLAALLGSVAGLRLAAQGDEPDVVLIGSGQPAPTREDAGLTPRELEVLALMAEGASNKTIARRLGISAHTVKFHVGQLLDKLDATGRTDAVAYAIRFGVIHL